MSSATWVLGVGLNVMGATSTNLGTVLIKYHTQVKKNVGWWKKIGLVFFVIGTVVTFLSFAYAAQSLLAGVSAVQFVTNLFFARYILREPFNRFNVSGTLVIIGGILLIVFSSVKSAPSLNVDAFFTNFYFSRNHFIYLAIIVSLAVILSFLFWFRTGIFPFWFRPQLVEPRLLLELSQPRSQTMWCRLGIPLLFVCLSAMIGAQSVVSGKTISVVLNQEIFKGSFSVLKKFPVYLALFSWITVAVFWVTHLGRAMRLFPGAFVISMTQVFWTFWTIISGGVVFDEFLGLAALEMSLLILGMITIFTGVLIVSKGMPTYSDDLTSRGHQLSRLRSLISSISLDGLGSVGFSVTGSNPVLDATEAPLPPYLRLLAYFKQTLNVLRKSS